MKFLVLALLLGCGPKTNPAGPGPEPTPSPTPDPAPPPATTAGQTCGTRGAKACPADQFCNYEAGAECGAADAPGHCAAKPQMCPQIFKPVCGCDGKQYSNSCTAMSNAVGVKTNGECPK
jgi:hypothetical protein